jgi:hypothetical protein
LWTPKPGFTGGVGQPPATPTDQLLFESPRWEDACNSPLIADVAMRRRPWEVLLEWVPQHNQLANALADIADSALGSAPPELAGYVGTIAIRLRQDASFAAEWASRHGDGRPASATPATVALLGEIELIGTSRSYLARAVVLWQWLAVQFHAWYREVMLRRPGSDLRQHFTSKFEWEVLRPFRLQLNRALRNTGRRESVDVKQAFDAMTALLADWQAERIEVARPTAPPGPLQPSQDALQAANLRIDAMQRLLMTTWDFARPLKEQVPALPEGITAVPEDAYLMVLLGGAFGAPADAQEVGEPPLDELLLAIAAGVERTAGPPAHHEEWGDPALKDAPFEAPTEAWVWNILSARIVLTSLYYDHHLPALVQAFVLPP